METWKAIPDYEGYYEISDHGRVRSLERTVLGKGGKTNLRRTRVRKTFVSNNGYPIILLSKNGVNRTFLLHRITAIVFIPNPDSLPEVDHIDRNRLNNTLTNLRWCNRKTNLENRASFERPIGGSGERYIILTKQENYQVRVNAETCLGTFTTIEQAVLVRDNYLKDLGLI